LLYGGKDINSKMKKYMVVENYKEGVLVKSMKDKTQKGGYSLKVYTF